MLDKITKYATLLPIAAVVVYILGYITLNSYLTSYGIIENIGLDSKIITAGILLSIIIGPIVLLTYSDFNVGDYSNADPDVSASVINTLHDALGYTILYSIALGNLLIKPFFDIPTYIMLGLLLIGLILNKIKIKTVYTKILKGIFIILPFFTLCCVTVASPISAKASLYLLQIAIFTTCASLRIFNKEGITFQYSKIGIIVTTICYTSTLFGAFIINRIPAEYGGEKHAAHYYFINQVDTAKIKSTSLRGFIKNQNSFTIEEIYDNSDKYYFKISRNKVIAIPKSYVYAEEIDIPVGYPK